MALGVVPLNETVTITASLDLSASILNLFVSDTLAGTATGVALADWSGGNDGGFFQIGGGAALKPNFSNAGSPEYTPPLVTEAEAISGLRMYGDTFVNAVPEPTQVSLLALAGLALLRRKRS